MSGALSELPSYLGKGTCTCTGANHSGKRIVVTGGPGAGKTAVVKLAQQLLCRHIAFVPEAASIIYGGGFWRVESPFGRKSSQRAIFHVQREMEAMVGSDKSIAAAICDRGTVDGLAYWPESEESYWKELGTTRDQEFERYAGVVHLRTPSQGNGYNHSNPLRTEDAENAALIDGKLLAAWNSHPNRIVIESTADFLQKAFKALEAIRGMIPKCCIG